MPLASLLRLCLLVLSLALPGVARADPLSIQASHAVLGYFAERIGGDAVAVTVPAPPGADPSAWRPTIPEIAAIQGAGLIVLNGAGYEGWATRVSLPRARTVDTTAALRDELIHITGLTHSHGDGPAHGHDGTAPKVWLDFGLAGRQAAAIAAAMAKQRPDDADHFAANLAGLQTDLAGLDTEARNIGASLAGQTVLVFQPGYEYFGRAYGIVLREVTFDAEAPATGAQLAALDLALTETGADLMLWNMAPPQATAEALAERGVVPVVFDDADIAPDGTDVLALLTDNLMRLRAALAPD